MVVSLLGDLGNDVWSCARPRNQFTRRNVSPVQDIGGTSPDAVSCLTPKASQENETDEEERHSRLKKHQQQYPDDRQSCRRSSATFSLLLKSVASWQLLRT